MTKLVTITLLIISIISGYVVGDKLSPALLKLQNKIRKTVKIKKYRIHHDFGGLVLISLSLILSPLWLQIAIAGLGLGLIIQHVTTEGFKLITKE